MSQQYLQAAEEIKEAILRGQYEAAKEVNRIQLALYYAIGRFISNNTRYGQWGTGALSAISANLKRMLPGLRGFSETNLKNMRKFYEQWPILDSNSAAATAELPSSNSTVITVELQTIDSKIDIHKAFNVSALADFPAEDFFNVPFTHHVKIIERVEDYSERFYYIHRQAEENMSVDMLDALISNDAFHHQAIMPSNFTKTMGNSARKAVMQFKDEYLLNFINIEEIGERDAADIDERVVEQQIVHNIKKFIMTIGRDFAFIGNQQMLEIYGVEHFPDLLFFNRELNAMVVIELKAGDFKPAYLGQLTTYLRILDDRVRKPHENPSVGIVLCRNANRNYVEYVMQDYQRPMGVATYKTSSEMPEKLRHALPDIEELKKLL